MLKLSKCKEEFLFVLEHIRVEDLQELQALWGKNWKENVLKNLEKTEVLILYGFDFKGEKIPIAMGGFQEVPSSEIKMACVWLLSTKFINHNKRLLMKNLRNQIKNASLKYDVLFNFIYKSNYQAKNWLKKLGFCFDNPNPTNMFVEEGFEFFYKKRKGN